MEGARVQRMTAISVAVLALLTAGCRLPGRDGPVSRSLATCRELSRQGIAALERGDTDQAETLLEEAVDTCAVDPQARRHYAEALWHRGCQTKAVEQLEEVVRLAPDDVEARVRLAEVHLAMGHSAQAAATVEQALNLDPAVAGPWAVRGRVAAASGDPRRALADFHRALGRDPGNRDVLLEVAELHRRLNQPQRALASLQSLADTYPPGEEPQQVLHLTGLAYMGLGRHEDAVATLSTAAVREAPSPDLLCHLGEAELLAGRPAAAAAAARHALSLRPQYPPAQALLSRMTTPHDQPIPPRR
jgi:tetratricopeptide (TPR) repeat protein